MAIPEKRLLGDGSFEYYYPAGSGILLAGGQLSIEATSEIVLAAGGSINVETGAGITADGTQASHIADADTAHDLNAVFSDTEVEAALDALGAKINAILLVVEGIGATATS